MIRMNDDDDDDTDAEDGDANCVKCVQVTAE